MWRDRRVIVTGGTAGFGLVLARHLAAAGAKVLVVGRSSEGVRLALAALETAGANVRGVAADLARPGEGGRVVGECLRIFGGLDDLFCCVGRSGRGLILETPEDELRAYLDANLFAAAEITRAAGRYAADVARAGLPAEAAAPGATAALRRLDPDDLARRVLDACRRRRSELTVPASARFLAGLIEWFPEAGRRWLARIAARGR